MRVWIVAVALAVAACGENGVSNEDTAPADASVAAPAGPIVVLSTASDARARMEQSGFTNVTEVARNEDGQWTASAVFMNSPVRLVIDDQGVVTIVE